MWKAVGKRASIKNVPPKCETLNRGNGNQSVVMTHLKKKQNPESLSYYTRVILGILRAR